MTKPQPIKSQGLLNFIITTILLVSSYSIIKYGDMVLIATYAGLVITFLLTALIIFLEDGEYVLSKIWQAWYMYKTTKYNKWLEKQPLHIKCPEIINWERNDMFFNNVTENVLGYYKGFTENREIVFSKNKAEFGEVFFEKFDFVTKNYYNKSLSDRLHNAKKVIDSDYMQTLADLKLSENTNLFKNYEHKNLSYK